MGRNILSLKQKKSKLEFYQRMVPMMAELRYDVENQNKRPSLTLRGGIYRGIDPDEILTIESDGWCIGYRLRDLGEQVLREVFIKCKEARFDEIPEKEKDAVVGAALEVFTDQGNETPDIESIGTDGDILRITQRFMPLVLKEMKPGLVVPGGTGYA